MEDTVTLCFRYTEKDYVQALQSHYAQRTHLVIDLAVLCVTASSGAYLLRDPGSQLLGWACVGVAVLFALMLVLAFFVIPRWVFRRSPKLHDEYTLVFTQEGIHFRTQHIDSRLQWSLYTSVLIGANAYILYYGKNAMSVIPHRVFSSSQQKDQFERLVCEKISKIVRSWK